MLLRTFEPENRLVAAELEARRNLVLEQVAELEARLGCYILRPALSYRQLHDQIHLLDVISPVRADFVGSPCVVQRRV